MLFINIIVVVLTTPPSTSLRKNSPPLHGLHINSAQPGGNEKTKAFSFAYPRSHGKSFPFREPISLPICFYTTTSSLYTPSLPYRTLLLQVNISPSSLKHNLPVLRNLKKGLRRPTSAKVPKPTTLGPEFPVALNRRLIRQGSVVCCFRYGLPYSYPQLGRLSYSYEYRYLIDRLIGPRLFLPLLSRRSCQGDLRVMCA